MLTAETRMAAAAHSGIFQFDFPSEEDNPHLVIDASRSYQEQVIREYKNQEDAPPLKCALKSSTLQYILRLSGEEEADQQE